MDNFNELPMGFGLALLQNPNASLYFNSLTELERQRLINKTHSINSKTEMEAFIQGLREQ